MTPRARLDDGLLDFMSIPAGGLADLTQILADAEHLATSEPEVIAYGQYDSFEIETESDTRAAVDGELLIAKQFRFDVLPRRLPFVLPTDSRALARSG